MEGGDPPLWAILYVLGNEVAAAVALTIAAFAWRRRDSSGAKSLVVLMTGGVVWCSSVVLRIVNTSPESSHLWNRPLFFGVGLVVSGWVAFALEFTGRDRYLTRRTAAFLALHPVALLVVTVGWPELMWVDIHRCATDITGVCGGWGPAFSVHTAYSYTVLGTGLVLLLQHIVTTRAVYRHQALAVLVGALVPFLGNFVYLFGPMPADLGPPGYAITGLAFAWASFGHDLMEFTPIARRAAWDELGDAVVTIDEDARVVDANEAAVELFDVEDDPLGVPASDFFDGVPDEVLANVDEDDELDTQIVARIEDETRHLSLSSSPIDRHDGEHAGHVLVLQDITELKRREQALQERERKLDLMRQVQSRVLRHNIRNELTTVQGNARFVESVIDEEHKDRVQDIIEASGDLLSTSTKARAVEDIVDERTEPVELDLRLCVERAIDAIREEHPEPEISLTGPEDCQVEAIPQLQVAIENLLENAIVHNASAPRVTVDVTDGDYPRLTISDNGSGIPEQEVDVLEAGTETSLEHGSGIGLWIVRWIVDRSDAELWFEADDDGTDVTIRFGSERQFDSAGADTEARTPETPVRDGGTPG